MLSRTPNPTLSMSQRAHAQRRVRRTSLNRQLCSTNGCTTYLEVDTTRGLAVCPICGYARRAPGIPAAAAH